MGDRVERERDLYKRLVELTHAESIEPLLKEALAHAVELSGAERVYLRLRRRDGEGPHPASLAHQCSAEEIDDIEKRISQAIVLEALARGETVKTMARSDERFRNRESVRVNAIDAVLCTPIVSSDPVGVLYLEGRTGAGQFDPEAVEMFEFFARHLGLLAHRLLEREEQLEATDPTLRWRAELAADGIMGRSQALADVLKELAGLARLPSVNVHIDGESGTGKTAMAEVLARSGARAAKPFVVVSCPNLVKELVEAELFGVRKGIHSTATEDRPGKIAAAEGGTLFLDEVAELPDEAQKKLLDFLNSRTYYPLGGNERLQADVRVVSATNVDLEERVREGTFREDLFYRLGGVKIRVPSLAERTEDIPDLVRHFLEDEARKNDTVVLKPTAGAIRAAQEAPWPGNVRSLQSACTAAFVRAVTAGAAVVEAHHFFPAAEGAAPLSYQEATRRFQKRLVKEVLLRHGGKVTSAAEELGLSRGGLYNLIKAFDLS